MTVFDPGAVRQSLTLHRPQRLLAALIEEATMELVVFCTQAAVRGAPSAPDADIVSSGRILAETKLQRQAIRSDQIAAL